MVLPPLGAPREGLAYWIGRRNRIAESLFPSAHEFEFESVMLFLIKRLKQPYREILLLSTETRLKFYDIEHELYLKEQDNTFKKDG